MAAALEETLERLAASPERFPGAFLLTGASAPQLERESRRIAARLLCPGDDPEARCGSCRRVLAGLHPDFFPVDPDGFQIKVDRIREALAFGAGRPYESAHRVARIACADLLGVEGANALLKSLEEPGERLRWILTSVRPESLLATIRSRCTPVALPAPGFSERQGAWQERGFSAEDARDLVLFAAEDAEDPAARLSEARALRQSAVAALEEGLVSGRVVPLVQLAEACAQLEKGDARVLAELLADAALAAHVPSSEALRHQAVAGTLARLSQHVGSAALREAALAAADPPPDIRRGNRRMHYEKVLLGLYDASRR
jgi:DNA polymerase-3 subunit delta'